MTTSRSEVPAAPVAPALAGAVRYLIGVDGGGTGTRARLQDRAGRTLGQGEAGPSGLSQGVEQAWRHVQEAIARAFESAGLPLPAPADCALGLGLAGTGVPARTAAFRQADPGYAHLQLDSDAHTQLLGVHGGAPGIVVAGGTGSVAAALYPDGRFRRVGGWGFPVGDEGSGAWLGLMAMRHAQAVLDGRVEPGRRDAALAQTLFDTIGATASALLDWCATALAAPGGAASHYARLAPWVFAAAEQGDPAAQALLQSAADALAGLADALQAADAAQAPLPVVATGSVGSRLWRLWPAALRERVVPPVGDSADGALCLVRPARVQQ
jgi:glucosamine kinase